MQIFQLRCRKVSLDGYHIFGDICYIAIAFGTSRLVIQLIVALDLLYGGPPKQWKKRQRHNQQKVEEDIAFTFGTISDAVAQGISASKKRSRKSEEAASRCSWCLARNMNPVGYYVRIGPPWPPTNPFFISTTWLSLPLFLE